MKEWQVRHRRGHRTLWIAALVIVASTASIGFAIYVTGYEAGPNIGGPSLMHATCGSLPNGTSSPVVHSVSGGKGDHAYFLVVETDPPSPYAGINGSYFVATTVQWPIMHVHVGQTVSVHVINCASSEAHGFQIQFYDDREIIAVQPGQFYDITFTATKAGTFRVYCDIYCAIHPLMQNGALVVN